MQKIFIFIFFISISCFAKNNLIIDSDMSFNEAIKGTKAPRNIIDNLVIIDVEYYSFDSKIHRGQIVIHKDIAKDIKEWFELVKYKKFFIKKVIPIVKYDWNDSLSMADNNTSCFNYRVVSGSKKLSNHAYGRAIDINPFQNPYKSNKDRITPIGAKYNVKATGTLSLNSVVTQFLLNRGWKWGGNYKTIKDWQHFDKR